ncbi:MAG TPA: phosphopantetheine-binding protein [Actinomycetota bacterium]|nr:phosphopantetheine-binding protein [Actinomycetota bacterium]
MSTPSPLDSDTAVGAVVDALVEVIGDEFLIDVEVTPATSFGGDLGLESIEFVALAEQLTNRYSGRVDFTTFLAGLTIDEILALTVGQLADHITASLARPVTQGTSVG